MTRYELHCKRCDQVLGYMTYPGSTKDSEILNSTQVFGEYHEILCPTCEANSLRAIQKGSSMIDKLKQAVADEFNYRASHGRPIYTMEEVIYIVNEVIDEVSFEVNKAEAQDQTYDFDMQMRVIKGDLKYLAEKVNKLSSLLEEQKIKGDKIKNEDLIDNAPTVEAYPFEQVQELVKLNQQFAQEIENLKRPQGEWILQYRCLDGEYYTCSQCERMILVEPEQSLSDYPYCHCGSHMKGGAE